MHITPRKEGKFIHTLTRKAEEAAELEARDLQMATIYRGKPECLHTENEQI